MFPGVRLQWLRDPHVSLGSRGAFNWLQGFPELVSKSGTSLPQQEIEKTWCGVPLLFENHKEGWITPLLWGWCLCLSHKGCLGFGEGAMGLGGSLAAEPWSRGSTPARVGPREAAWASFGTSAPHHGRWGGALEWGGGTLAKQEVVGCLAIE